MNFEVVIIGAGPAGISMAAEAINSGIDSSKVIVLEKAKEHSWAIRKFYPEQKLVTANYKGNAAICNGVMCISDSTKSEALSYLDETILKNNINVHYEETVYKIHRQDDGSFIISSNSGEYHAKTCVIAIGMMGKPNKPDYNIPSDVRDMISYDITSVKILNKNVLVVGGGDSASEYAQYLVQEGNNVSLSYRQKELIRMNNINSSSLLALRDSGKINLLLKTNITGLESEENKVKVIFQEREPIVYDHIVFALGGSTPKNFLSLLGIEFNGNDPVIKEGFETSIPGLFLIGDLSAGRKGGSIILAFNSAHEAMKKMCDDYLVCKL